MTATLRRDDWHGQPIKLADTIRMTHGEHAATCELWSHQSGWELRLDVGGEIRRRQVCRTQDEVFDCTQAWRHALLEKGWRG